MTIRFGNQVRLASRDRFRQMLLIDRDPGDIVSFAELQALMQRHRAQVRGVSRDAEFLRWLMYREGSGTGWGRAEAIRGCFDNIRHKWLLATVTIPKWRSFIAASTRQ